MVTVDFVITTHKCRGRLPITHYCLGLRFTTPVGRYSSLSATPARCHRPPSYGGPIGLHYVLPLPKRLLNVDGNGGLCLFFFDVHCTTHDRGYRSGVSAHHLCMEMCIVPLPLTPGQTWLFSTPVLHFYVLPPPKRLLNVDGSGGLCLFVMCIVPPHDTDGSSGVSAHRLRWEMCVVPPPPSSGQTWLFSTPVLQPHITSSLCVWLVSKEKTHPRLKRKMAAVKRNGRFTSSTFHLITDVSSPPQSFALVPVKHNAITHLSLSDWLV